ncbi:hypothetical protein DFH11DRAFT_1569766 [Phellopilus nigrolimitatus]|nr:hypothetical protein DFH11DRAFT_1569766 [Phellopilus nigrolimitatus]
MTNVRNHLPCGGYSMVDGCGPKFAWGRKHGYRDSSSLRQARNQLPCGRYSVVDSFETKFARGRKQLGCRDSGSLRQARKSQLPRGRYSVDGFGTRFRGAGSKAVETRDHFSARLARNKAERWRLSASRADATAWSACPEMNFWRKNLADKHCR